MCPQQCVLVCQYLKTIAYLQQSAVFEASLRSTNVNSLLFSSQEETAGDVTEKKKLFKDLQENVNGAGRKLIISE